MRPSPRRSAQSRLATSCSSAPSASVSLRLAQLREQQQRVGEDVALGVVVGRLLDALHRRDLRQHVREQAGLVEQLEAAPRGAFGEDAHDLVADALPGDAGDRRGVGANGREGRRLDGEAEARREAHGAQHAQAILVRSAPSGSPMARMTPAARSARPPTKSSTSPVSGSRNMPLMVKSRRCASSSGVAGRTPTGRRPSRYSSSVRKVATSIGWPVDHDEDDAELGADRHGAREQRLHLGGGGVGRDVEVGRRRSPRSQSRTQPPAK